MYREVQGSRVCLETASDLHTPEIVLEELSFRRKKRRFNLDRGPNGERKMRLQI